MNSKNLGDLSKIVVAQIKSKRKHENADRLNIVEIDAGQSNDSALLNENGFIQVVTAANNFEVNDLVAWAAPGCSVPGWVAKGDNIVLESRDMRGQISHGMILAEDELGIGKDHEGIFVIDKKHTNLIGSSVSKVQSLLSKPNDQDILQDLKKVTTEILGAEDLLQLLSTESKLNHYIGFEISGLVHLGQGLMSGIVIRELQKLGINTRIFLADWHTWINNKLKGDMEFIQKVASEYFIPAMKSAISIAGGNADAVEFILGSNLYHNNDKYWQTVVDISKNLTLSRVLKSTTILGRESSQSMEFAMLIYPSMQAADIFEMQNHIAHAGTDQRNVHVIAREVASKITVQKLMVNNNSIKPISIHHELVPGLQKPSEWPLPKNISKHDMLTSLKMSKSIPDSAIFIQDDVEEIKRKINQAFCPEKEIGYNPVLSWVRLLIFPINNKFELKREARYGGDRIYKNYSELESDYANGTVFPLDLKNNVAETLIKMLQPARDVFNSAEKKMIIQEILAVRKTR